MLKRLSPLAVLAIFLLLSACATAEGPAFRSLPVVAEGKAQYVFIRTLDYTVKKYTHPNIYIDGDNKGPLLYGGYTVINVLPGAHHIRIEGNIFSWDFNDLKASHQAEAGNTYFFELRLEMAGYNRYRASIRQAEKAYALQHLPGLKLNQ